MRKFFIFLNWRYYKSIANFINNIKHDSLLCVFGAKFKINIKVIAQTSNNVQNV